MSELGIIQLLAEQAREVIAVMDSSKVGKRSRVKLLELQQVDRMVSDNGITEAVRREYQRQGLLIE